MQTIAPVNIERIFKALDGQIGVAGGKPISLVVIGGTALAALNPSGKEVLAAARWTLTQDVSETFKELLKDFLIQHGYDNVAQEL